MSQFGSKGWVSLALLLPMPLLMGAKGCAGRTSMGSDYAGEAGMPGEEATGGSGGKGAMLATGGRTPDGMLATGGRTPDGMPATGGVGPDGMMATGGMLGVGGKGASCAGFEDTDFRDDVRVRYVNDGSEPLYIGRTGLDTCGGQFRFEVRDEAGTVLEIAPSACISCKALQSGQPMCPTICERGEVVRVDPGGRYDYSWSGTYWAQANMPKACYGASGFDTCSMLVPAPSGRYYLFGTAWSDVDCDPARGCQQCMPGESGSCLLSGLTATAGTSRQVQQVLEYPRQKLVEFHFD